MDRMDRRKIAIWMGEHLSDYITYGTEVDCTQMAEHAAIEFDIEDDDELEKLFELSFDVAHEEGYA